MSKKDGKFSSEYQPGKKWTKDKAIKLGEELIEWLKEKDEDGEDKGNTLFEEFLVIKKDLYPEIISYLSKTFVPFFNLIEKARKIQEIKLHKYGLADRFNAQIVKFSLINNHGWKDKQEIQNNNNHNFNEIPIIEIIDAAENPDIKKI